MPKNNFLRVTHNDIPFLIFSQKELKRMLDYSEISQDNIVLVHDDNSIGTVYGITNQNHWNNQQNKTDINLLDITDNSNW